MAEVISGDLGRETTTETVVNAPVKKAVDTSLFGTLESAVKLVGSIGKGMAQDSESEAVSAYATQLNELRHMYHMDEQPSMNDMNNFNLAVTKLNRSTNVALGGNPDVIDKVAKTYKYVMGEEYVGSNLSQAQKDYNSMTKEIDKLPFIERTGDRLTDEKIVLTKQKEKFDLDNLNNSVDRLRANNQFTDEQKKYATNKATETLFAGSKDVLSAGLNEIAGITDPAIRQEKIGILRGSINSYVASRVSNVPPAIAADVAKDLTSQYNTMLNLVEDSAFSAEQKQKVINSINASESLDFYRQNPGYFNIGLQANLSKNQMDIMMNELASKTMPKNQKGLQALTSNPDTTVKVATNEGEKEVPVINLLVDSFNTTSDINALINAASISNKTTSKTRLLDEVAKTTGGIDRVRQVNTYSADVLKDLFPDLNGQYITDSSIRRLRKTLTPEQQTLVNAYNNTLKVLRDNSKSK